MEFWVIQNVKTGMFVGNGLGKETMLTKARLFTTKCSADAAKVFPSEQVRRVVTDITLKLKD